MLYKDWYDQALSQLIALHGEREARSLLRVLIEDFPIKKQAFDTRAYTEVQSALNRLLDGEPVQYICGKAYFYDSTFKVSASVLIPRPETEELVDHIIKTYKSQDRALSIVDIGTGSGCIAIMLKKHLPSAHVLGLDVSEDALAIARDNAVLHRTDVQFEVLDFLDERHWSGLGRQWDVIVSNPPYIPLSERHQVGQSCLTFEPHQALFTGDRDGMEFYSAIAKFGRGRLTPNGHVFLELNEFRAAAIEQCFSDHGYQTGIIKDLSGKDRILRCRVR